jgi:ketosteroid isomerase-like protein
VSQENVESIERGYAALAEGNLEEVVARFHPEIELRGAVGGLEQGEVIRGRDAVARELLPDSSVWAERRFILQELIDADDRVVALVREQRRGRASGVEVGTDMALVYTFGDGEVTRIEPFLNQSEALASIGR